MSNRLFYRLFFHWSYRVREAFYKLMLYQVEYHFVIKTANLICVDIEIQKYYDQNLFFDSLQNTASGSSEPMTTHYNSAISPETVNKFLEEGKHKMLYSLV